MFPALRLLFNAVALLGLLGLAVLLAVLGLRGQPLDWPHLALGRLISESGSLPHQELLLFSAPGAGFDAGSWAWDWAASQGLRWAGPAVLRWSDALLVLTGALALAGTGYRRGARPFSTGIFLLWALASARADLSPGPSVLGFSALCVALWLMEGGLWQAFFNRWIWLGPLAVVCVNATPAAWALAPLVGLWLVTEADDAGAPAQPRLAKILFFILLLLCLCVHPQGVLPLGRALASLPPSPLAPGSLAAHQGGLLLLAVAASLLLASSWTAAGRRHLGRDAALLALFGLAGLLSRAALPAALAVAALVSAARLDLLVDALPRLLRALRWPAKLLGMLAMLLWLAGGGLPDLASPPEAWPLQSEAFYEQELLNLRVLCPPAWGGWLAYRLAPSITLGLDSRGLGATARVQALLAALDARQDWSAILDGEGVEACWIPLGSPLALALGTAQAWQPVSFDDESVLFVKATPATAELIRVQAPRGLKPGDPRHPFDPSRLAQAEADLEARLSQDPACGVLYLYKAELWLAEGQEAKARQTLEAGIRADPGFAPDYARLADLRAAKGDLEPAAALYRHALRLRDRPEWRESLARIRQG